MPDVREVYEMVTKQKPPELGALERQQKRQVRSARNEKLGAFAVAAAIGVAAVVLFIATREGPSTTTPPNQAAADATPVEVATDFLEAFGAFDVERASTYLADGATISSMAATDDLRLLISWLEATGYQQILDPCEETGISTTGTRVRCAFDFHVLRSSEMGLGPYTGSSFGLIVRDGEIVEVGQAWAFTEGFSPEVWEPFADWVSTAHPADAEVMYTDASLTNVRLTEESIRLWERRTQQYVEEVGAGT